MRAPTPNVSRALVAASRAHIAAVVAALSKRGFVDVSVASASLLWLIDDCGARSATLAQRAEVSKQAMSQLVRSMEAQGYLEQVRDRGDTRAKIVRLTAHGIAVRNACVEVREELNRKSADLVSRDFEAQLDALTSMFSGIADEISSASHTRNARLSAGKPINTSRCL